MRTLLLGCAAAALIACGGRTNEAHGLEGPTVEETSGAYPTGDFGYEVGKVLPNVAFLGYQHLDPDTAIDTALDSVGVVHFSDYYDPDGARGLRYLVVAVQVGWCPPSNEEEDFVNGASGAALKYEASGVRFMTLLQEGPAFGTDATEMDLLSWTKDHSARTTQALISHQEINLDVVGAAWPYNMIIDTKTMRVVATWLGFYYGFGPLDALIRDVRG
jgi:hypothetical protein